jgi:hypothetical protein
MMKHFFVAASLALGLSGCSESPSVLQIVRTNSLSSTCSVNESSTQAAGSLNLAYGRNYFLAFQVTSSYRPTPIEVNGVPLDEDTENNSQANILLDGADISYSVTPNVRVPSSTLKFTGTILPGSVSNRVVLNLLSQDAADALASGVTAGEVYRMAVTVKLKGKFAAGGGSVDSNEFTYYVDLTNNPPASPLPACAPGAQPVGPCGSAGQDGAIPTCK